MVLALLLGLSPVPTALFATYDSISAIKRVNNYEEVTGFRVEYLLEAVAFLYIILKNYEKIPFTRANIVLLNMALIFCALLLVYIRNDNGGRISWYYMIGLISTLTLIFTQKRQRMTMPFVMIALCFCLYLRIYTSWNKYLSLYPYKTFFTNGYRKGDYSWTHYEYDHNYDKDKLYRDPIRFSPNF